MISNQVPAVGLLGATGNLGSAFLRESRNNFDNLVGVIGRASNPSRDFNILENGLIQTTDGKFPKIIVNLSNSYTPNPTQEQLNYMETVIIGVSEVISRTVQESGCSVISASSYFQFCPIEMQPWSHYSHLKGTAREILEKTAHSCQSDFTDFILYDNYGGLHRNKFVDLLEDSLLTGKKIDCSNGEQVLNLTHTTDLVSAFINEVENMSSGKSIGIHTFELKSNFTANLRKIALIAENASGKRGRINWGAIPYRSREVFELWDTGFDVPSSWNPKVEFASYIEEKFLNQIERK